MPRQGVPSNGEKQNATNLNSSHNLSLSDHHDPDPSSSLHSSSDVLRAEQLAESPNPSVHVHVSDRGPSQSLHNVSRKPPPVFHPFSIHVLSLLMSSSVFGTLARLGIHALATYDGQSIFPLAWVQAAGCGIMGFALALRDPITLFYGPLYTAITTGFCGSLTTFSGWQLDVFQAWADASGFKRLWIYDVMDGLTRTLFTLAVSLGSFGLGKHLGKRIAPRIHPSSHLGSVAKWIITIISIALYVLTIPFFVRLNHSWRPLATAALVFSFPGTLTRYILSTQLNPRLRAFPLGTLIANELATALLAACHIIQRAPSPPSPVACSILQGFIDGFCGCLSTVSTFVVELRTLQGRKAWIYFALSFVLGQIILLVMLGPSWWTGRIIETRLCSFG